MDMVDFRQVIVPGIKLLKTSSSFKWPAGGGTKLETKGAVCEKLQIDLTAFSLHFSRSYINEVC